MCGGLRAEAVGCPVDVNGAATGCVLLEVVKP